MTSKLKTYYSIKFKRIGNWIGIRYLRNQGLPFFLVYEIAVGRPLPAKYASLAMMRQPKLA